MKILIIRPSSLGDILLLSPCVRLLKKAYPESKITLLIKSHFSEVASLIPHLDSILCFEKKESIFSIIKRIREEQFDLVVDLHRGLRAQILYLFSGAKRKVHYQKNAIVRFLLIFSRLNFGPGLKPVSSKYIEALKPLGISNDGEGPILSLSNLNPDEVVKRFGVADRVISIAPGAHHDQDEEGPILSLSKLNPDEVVKKFGIADRVISIAPGAHHDHNEECPILSLSKLNSDEVVKKFGVTDRVISIAPGAHHDQKEWSVEKYAELAEGLCKTYSAKILLLGDEKDRVLATRIKNLARCEMRDLTGKTSITELACLIGKSLVFISPDTGSAHIADGLGISHVVLFGPTVRSFGFYPQKGAIVEKDLPCRPCSLHGEKPCKSKECLEKIEVSDVMEAIDSVLHKKPYISIKPKKILVIQTAFLGDIILTTPLLRNLKERFPESKISFLTTPQGAEILSGNPCISDLIVYDKKGRDTGIIPFLKMAGRIKEEGFSLVVSPHKSFRTSLLAFISGASRRIGFDTASLSFLYADKIQYEKQLHEVDRYLQLMETLGGKIEAKPEVFITSNGQKRADSLLSSFGIKSKDMVIGLLIGSEWQTKRWHPEGYADLIDYLAERFSAKLIIFGEKKELAIAEKIAKLCRNKPIIACGKTTLADLPPLFMACELLIGGDTGTMHIGVALKRKCVVIFGPTTPELGFSPYKAESAVIIEKKGLACRPCSPHGPKRCPKGHFACMKDIGAEDVINACEGLIYQNKSVITK